MIIFAHPRSGSTALLKIFKWINETHYDKKTLDLGEFLNIGALHNSKNEHSSVMNRGRDTAHMWRPFYQPLIQHFIHEKRIEPIEHCYCEIDTKVFDMDFSTSTTTTTILTRLLKFVSNTRFSLKPVLWQNCNQFYIQMILLMSNF